MVSPLIKNLAREHAAAFWNTGSVRVGTAFQYRTTEDEARRDVGEATTRLHIRPHETIRMSSSDFSKYIPPGIEIRNGFVQMGTESAVHLTTEWPNCYMFCVSEQSQPKFGGASYRIVDPIRFRNLLFVALKDIDPGICYCRVDRVHYADTPVLQTKADLVAQAPNRLSVPDRETYFHKPPSYANEREWRFVFVTDSPTPLPQIVSCPVLHDCCEP